MIENNIYKSVFKVTHAGGSGSCSYLKNHDLFVTNYHVVEGFRKVAITDDKHNSFLANVVLVNPSLDLALLDADGDFSHLPEITLSDDKNMDIGQKICVAGYPFGLPFTVTMGTVSSPKQLLDGSYYIQTDAAVNPGNSGGPMFNEANKLVAVTVSKLTDADNMGFGIPVSSLNKLLESISELDRTKYNVQCSSCEEFLIDDEEFCPSCGNKLPKEVFKEVGLTDLALFCEEAISDMGINPILARVGYESWKFHKGSSEIRMFVFQGEYLFSTSPINILPKKNLEPVLTYMLEEDTAPYKLGLDENQIYLTYRVHISDIFSNHRDTIKSNLTNLAFKADELDNFMVEKFGCEMSEYSKKEA